MSDRYAALRAALDAGPTPGPWFADEHGKIWRRNPKELYENGGCVAGDRALATANVGWHGEGCVGFPAKANASLIAAANPETIRALLADYDRMREALFWNAAALNECCKDCVQEASNITIAAETKCFSEILDMADAALAQEQGGSDGGQN